MVPRPLQRGANCPLCPNNRARNTKIKARSGNMLIHYYACSVDLLFISHSLYNVFKSDFHIAEKNIVNETIVSVNGYLNTYIITLCVYQ